MMETSVQTTTVAKAPILNVTMFQLQTVVEMISAKSRKLLKAVHPIVRSAMMKTIARMTTSPTRSRDVRQTLFRTVAETGYANKVNIKDVTWTVLPAVMILIPAHMISSTQQP